MPLAGFARFINFKGARKKLKSVILWTTFASCRAAFRAWAWEECSSLCQSILTGDLYNIDWRFQAFSQVTRQREVRTGRAIEQRCSTVCIGRYARIFNLMYFRAILDDVIKTYMDETIGVNTTSALSFSCLGCQSHLTTVSFKFERNLWIASLNNNILIERR